MEQQTKACPYCGEEILSTAKKCKHCGTFLEKQCPECGEWIKIEAIKCKHCGAWLNDEEDDGEEEENNDYEEEENVSKVSEERDDESFFGGCLGQILGCVVFILIVAYIGIPSKDKMRDDIYNEIMDSAISQIKNESAEGYALMGLLGMDKDLEKNAKHLINIGLRNKNRIRVEKKMFYAVGYVENSKYPDGKPVAIGLFWVTIPYDDDWSAHIKDFIND